MNYNFEKSPHLAVCLPEVVSHIVSFLVPAPTDDPKKKFFKDLYPCLFVNHLWYDCTTRLFWKKAFFDDTPQDFEAFLKFASTLYKLPSPPTELFDIDTQVSRMPNTVSSMLLNNEPMLEYRSRSSSISSVSTFDSINTPFECSLMDFKDEEAMTIGRERMNKGIDHFNELADTRIKMYRNSLKSLSIRKMKQKSINEPLIQIGQNATKLEYLDIYICDEFSNETLYPFLLHQRLTYLSLAGCNHISDEAILKVAEYCKGLEHLDLRACGSVSDISISAIAMNCPRLEHLNVGRVKDREKVTSKSITLIAKYTKASVLGLAGCDIDDKCLETLAKYRQSGLERVSVNSCYRISNRSVHAFIKNCPNLSVFEMKECHQVHDWEAIAVLVQRNVLLTLCDHQNKACADWARVHGRKIDIRTPLK